MATASSRMTTEDLLAIPEDGTDRWLIAGELRERPMTRRNRFHSRVMIRVGKILDNWLDEQPEPRGQVLGGEAGVILGHDPDTTVGLDVTYISAEVMVRQTEDSTLIDGVPTLVAEILSPSDTIEDITPASKFRMLLHTNPTRERGECLGNPRWHVGRYVRFESPLHAGLQAEGPVAGVSG